FLASSVAVLVVPLPSAPGFGLPRIRWSGSRRGSSESGWMASVSSMGAMKTGVARLETRNAEYLIVNSHRLRLVGARWRGGAPSLLRRLVLGDLRVDLVAVRTLVRPGVDQILRAQRGVGAQQIRFAHPEAARLDDAWLTAADARHATDAREVIAQVANHRPEQLRFLGAI